MVRLKTLGLISLVGLFPVTGVMYLTERTVKSIYDIYFKTHLKIFKSIIFFIWEKFL
jgi:hypothetical protein